ncbi:helix-turn-helix transcriptional regulator [Ancylobacter dichloromethanicus]|uniref:Transcriptional regulator n=1 Tax=Ancylobacter dichloromethanicus TaxID=518825 RepID=A0A9W6JEH6_9HYPH|nr:helix-turn-helix domain-containing protein [Ancylobacter dichloromethanicus]MBS7552916.1 helix-turn-helix transcriptional regulator [Ancylobacter dichloromethanicus]GLK74519.1 transcriptional regulator [Ancylobacter dichloromethanicus]
MEGTTDDASVPEVCVPSVVELNEFRQAVNMITGRWKIDILWVLLAGPMRFGELRRALPGITQHMLTAQLRALEADGLIARTAYAEIPPRVEYALTDNARALKPIFEGLADWARSLRRGHGSRLA